MIKVNNKVLCEHCFAQTGREPCPECGFDSNTYICDPMTLRAGSILAGRYAIGRVIGKGGFGVTYLAYDLKLECRVAVKEYYPYGIAARVPGSTQVSVSEAKETFQSGAEKFYDEARLVAQFNGNPNIVSVHDFFYENNTVYFTMGYLDGQTLKDYLKEHGALTPGQAVYVADAVSNALTAAHGRNVLHRDIAPDNIMVCRDGSIKLLDFGAARQVLTEGSQSLSVILKQGFAPLEQYQKKGKQGPWTDIYSLGATLYHALTLDTLDDPMSRLEGDEEYHSNVHGIEEELWRIIKKATMLRSADRYQDVYELRKDMGGLSIEPVPLTVAGAAKEEGVGVCPEAAGEDDIGVTMPLQEEKNADNSNAVRESGKAEDSKARPGIESVKYGICMAAICLVIQSVAAVIIANNMYAVGYIAADYNLEWQGFDHVVELYRISGFIDRSYAYFIFIIFQAVAVVGGVVFFSLTPYLPIIYRNRKTRHRMIIKMVWLAGVIILIVAGVFALDMNEAEYIRNNIYNYDRDAIDRIVSLEFAAALLEGAAVCLWGIFSLEKYSGKIRYMKVSIIGL